MTKYLNHTIEQERNGTFSVYHRVYHYRGNFKSIEAAQQFIRGL